MEVREFWLTNSDNNRYDLNNESHFFHDPDGLGITVAVSSIKVGDSEMLTDKEYELDNITGELLFIDTQNATKYENYVAFMRFMAKAPVYFHYQTPGSETSYSCLVQVLSIGKSEIETDSMLHCPLVFKRLTLWTDDSINVIEATTSSEVGKRYELQRPYHYGIVSTSNIELINNGMSDAPLKFEVIGTTTNLGYNLSQNSVIYGRGRLIGTYDYIMVDSNDLSENIVLRRNNVLITNSFNYQDLSVGSPNKVQVTFLKLRPGKNLITFSLGATFGGEVRITWANTYLSV